MRESPADPARSENLCMCGLFMRENREIPRLPSCQRHVKTDPGVATEF